MSNWSLLLSALLTCGLLAAALYPAPAEGPAALDQLFRDGNYKDAYEGYRQRLLDPATPASQVAHDLERAIACLEQLGRLDEIDALREKAVQTQPQNWRLLRAAAESYLNVNHTGMLVAGKFERGGRRGGGQPMNSTARDRVRALQLLVQVLPLLAQEADKAAAADLHFVLARALLTEAAVESWRLQLLTDLENLPDYETGWYFRRGTPGAPVGPDGQPVYYHVPANFEAAQNDGERWRWALSRAAELDPARQNDARWELANFCKNQFGVRTLAQFGPWFGRTRGDDTAAQHGVYSLDTLAESETIARLATGIQRFTLPDEFNYIKLFQQIGADPQAAHADEALKALVNEFNDRRQYPRAAEYCRTGVRHFAKDAFFGEQLQQIVGNWGRFEPAGTQATGNGAVVDFRFRNAREVHFEAQRINVDKLLADVKTYLRSNPRQLDWQKVNIGDIGYRLVEQNQQQYLGERAAAWDLKLEPRENHFDRRVTVTTPLTKAGAYLLTARLPDGNTSRIVLWVADMAIVKKPLADKSYYFVADAVTGQPIAGANVELFGFRTDQQQNRLQLQTTAATRTTDANGQTLVNVARENDRYNWLITARTPQGKLAFLGFTNAWYAGNQDQRFAETKVFTITDRPVYRPDQVVKFKFWIRETRYDQEGASFAGQPFKIMIFNPRGDKVLEREGRADELGGIDGEYQLPADAVLGEYQLQIENRGGGSFRVEEYKKPEFEVTVEAPTKPVMLGEKIAATIKARYYFGAPVTQAKVHYKILRSDYTARWYPLAPWDWLYGAGYGWFAYDYRWYPRWSEWGCPRPLVEWWPRSSPQPEVVAEADAQIGADGTVTIEIDTAIAKELHGDTDHEYSITAEVVDQSRRTIVGSGKVLVARQPFQVMAWIDRGFYRVGDTVQVNGSAYTLDRQPVKGAGRLTLYRVAYDAKRQPIETLVREWDLATDEQGNAAQKFEASAAGQYRLAYRVTDEAGHSAEGGYLFTVRGEGVAAADFRFNHVELIPEAREYQPGGKVRLLINTDQADSTVLLFLRPAGGVYPLPKLIRISGKSAVEEFEVAKGDMPNFFVEAVTISQGQVYSETKEIVVPPESRVFNVDVTASAADYKPGQEAEIRFKLTDLAGRPFVGSTVVTVYDKSLEYISGGSNVPDIKEFFWKWRRRHHPVLESSLQRGSHNLVKSGQPQMSDLGAFGSSVADDRKDKANVDRDFDRTAAYARGGGMGGGVRAAMAEPMALAAAPAESAASGAGDSASTPLVTPVVRSVFADTAFWVAQLTTGPDGTATVRFKLPENLTTWKTKVWGMGAGTRVGQGEAEVVTRKDLLVRMQVPRFFVETDEVVLSANVHNYLATAKSVQVALELEGAVLQPLDDLVRTVSIAAGGEARVDWRVRVAAEGTAVVRMKALTDEESDAVEMRFPSHVHGMLKTESFAGVVRPEDLLGRFTIHVPAERRPEQSRLEIRYSPSLAAAIVDAVPYLVEYPYGCTEQTLNRFVPTVVAQRVLLDMKLDLATIRDKRVNLNAQELGDPQQRAASWKRFERNPVFDEQEVRRMVQAGVTALTEMQVSDGGWGWFSGWGERSWPHTTATVVHGLQVAQAGGAAIPQDVLARGVAWLDNYQAEQLRLLANASTKTAPYKEHADNIDALVYMVLVDAGAGDPAMREALYRDRTELAVYAKALLGLALHKQSQHEQLAMILQNIEQFLVQDDENQTAYLRLPEGTAWWQWYGNDIEAMAYYLKLLSRTTPQSEVTARLTKYLLNNRRHGSYWNSTRDTALCVEAIAEFCQASGESSPQMTVEVWIDGVKQQEAVITAENLFSFPDHLSLSGEAVTAGDHVVELRKRGTGPLYYNAYLTNFTREDPLTAAGLEIKIDRHYYKLVPADAHAAVAGQRGQAIAQRVEKFERQEIANLAELRSVDKVEIELTIDSKNDYEYLIFEDLKPAGFEPDEVRSGYTGNALGAYVEFRDDRVAFFTRSLPRGRHSIAYRMRAETPGRFSALPARGAAMYAPELRGNSAEFKVIVTD